MLNVDVEPPLIPKRILLKSKYCSANSDQCFSAHELQIQPTYYRDISIKLVFQPAAGVGDSPLPQWTWYAAV